MVELVIESCEINDRLWVLVILYTADDQGYNSEDAANALWEIPGLELPGVPTKRMKAFSK
jgi:hypothetical protein